MKRFVFLYFILFCLALGSCEQEKVTYSDKIEEEKIFLSQFAKEQGFVVLNEFPENGVFAENEFVLLDSGVYLHISDYGEGTSPAKEAKIQTVAKGCFLGEKENESFDGFDASAGGEITWPLEFTYGENFLHSSDNKILSEGYMSALQYVGNNSTVSMIVPFKVGSSYQNVHMVSVYFEKIKFTFGQ